MMQVRWCWSVLFAVVLMQANDALAAESKIILQDNFESDPWKAGWSPHGAGTFGKNVVWSADEPHGGRHCLEVTPKLPEKPNAGWESPPFLVEADKSYRVTFYGRSKQPAYWFLMFYDRSGALVEGDISCAVDPTDEWTRYEGVYKPKYPSHTATFVFYTVGGEAMAVDDLKIEECDRTQTLVVADREWAAMPTPTYRAPIESAKYLPRTLAKLKHGERVKIVLLGDSIANDLSNSNYAALLERAFPGVKVDSQFTGRGGTGWLKHQFQIEQRVAQHKPDLAILMAVSNDPDNLVETLTNVIERIHQESPATELLVVTPHLHGWYGANDIGDRQRQVLLEALPKLDVAWIDQQPAWDDYLKANSKGPEWLLRDGIHMNNRGRELSARMIVDYLQMASKRAPK